MNRRRSLPVATVDAISCITCHGSPHRRPANVQGIIIDSALDDSNFMKYEDEKWYTGMCSFLWAGGMTWAIVMLYDTDDQGPSGGVFDIFAIFDDIDGSTCIDRRVHSAHGASPRPSTRLTADFSNPASPAPNVPYASPPSSPGVLVRHVQLSQSAGDPAAESESLADAQAMIRSTTMSAM
ncbi:hypothetical protein FIBSPDRAFT_877556 [Athelia psychrophila]|uniref:Uncharacterized protein n=1 Tax=Athelia psychrophila TaxID=1759441 RepID=A0A167VV25_9AGAM|nr:hypothetical protein FIBSPDRAFT_877556 [Fibularhizoctonia sp. CBS 109695]